MIDCEKCREMISCLLDGELSEAEQSLVREHIASCPECRSVYDAFSAVSEQMHEEESLPDGLHEKIMSGIKAKPKKKTGIVWIKYLSVAACLAPCHIRRSQKRYVRTGGKQSRFNRIVC